MHRRSFGNITPSMMSSRLFTYTIVSFLWLKHTVFIRTFTSYCSVVFFQTIVAYSNTSSTRFQHTLATHVTLFRGGSAAPHSLHCISQTSVHCMSQQLHAHQSNEQNRVLCLSWCMSKARKFWHPTCNSVKTTDESQQMNIVPEGVTLPLARHDRHPGMATSATRTGIGVSAGITAGARRSRRLQGLPPAMAGLS